MNLHKSWNKYLEPEFKKDYFLNLEKFINDEKNLGKIIYPREKDIFAAFNLTPFDDVKVVILGQDPYHGEGQSHGLSFSVKKGVKIPPSLVNIFKEIKRDFNISIPCHGNLESWGRQGVLLLNNVLTVEASKAGSHQKKGWEIFTDKVIEILNSRCDGIVFMLWGAHAQKKEKAINLQKHYILKSVHPSPLSAYRGFIGCSHFSLCNSYLKKIGKQEIDWSIN